MLRGNLTYHVYHESIENGNRVISEIATAKLTKCVRIAFVISGRLNLPWPVILPIILDVRLERSFSLLIIIDQTID